MIRASTSGSIFITILAKNGSEVLQELMVGAGPAPSCSRTTMALRPSVSFSTLT